MNAVVALSLQMLHWSCRTRLALVLCTHVLVLGLYALTFPTTLLGGALILPLILSAWLFRWRGSVLSITSITLLLGAAYGIILGNTFWTSPWFIPFTIGTLFGLVICLTVSILRQVTDTLLKAQQKIVYTEQAYQQEHALNELKDQVLQNLKHELQTPLTQIQGYLELLEEGQQHFDAETQARFFLYARNGCDELHSLIKTALDTSVSAEPARSYHPVIFSLQHEAQVVIAHFEPQFFHEHRIELDIAATIQVYADPRFFRQVLRNLLTNAYKYTPAQTNITVKATSLLTTGALHEQADMICVSVIDEGPGIAPELQQQLFQRFVRLPNAVESTQSGSGLGLAISKQLVEAMGGSIWVTSSGRNGEGCSFSFTLIDGAAANTKKYQKANREQNDQTKEVPNGQFTLSTL